MHSLLNPYLSVGKFQIVGVYLLTLDVGFRDAEPSTALCN